MAKPLEGYSEPILLEIERIDPRPASEIRIASDAEAVVTYVENFNELPPLKVVCDSDDHHWLADGRHRLDAAKKLGKSVVSCVIKRGTYVDAFGEAAKANDTHGVRVTNADKRHRVEVAIKHPEMKRWSNRRIAEHCGVAPITVDRLRSSIELPQSGSSKTVGKDGKVRSAPKRRRTRQAPSDPEPQSQPSDADPDDSSTAESASAAPGETPDSPSTEQSLSSPTSNLTPEEVADSVAEHEDEPETDQLLDVLPEELPSVPPSQDKPTPPAFDCDARWDQFENFARHQFNSWPLNARGDFAMRFQSLATELVMSCPEIRVHTNVTLPFKDRA